MKLTYIRISWWAPSSWRESARGEEERATRTEKEKGRRVLQMASPGRFAQWLLPEACRGTKVGVDVGDFDLGERGQGDVEDVKLQRSLERIDEGRESARRRGGEACRWLLPEDLHRKLLPEACRGTKVGVDVGDFDLGDRAQGDVEDVKLQRSLERIDEGRESARRRGGGACRWLLPEDSRSGFSRKVDGHDAGEWRQRDRGR